MVEQIDRENEALQEWAEQGRSIERAIAEAVAAERARILAAFRQPDAAMVKRVGIDIDTAWHVCESLPPIEFRNHERDLLATAALSAAADAMEAGQ